MNCGQDLENARITGSTYIISGVVDPTQVPVAAYPGTVYLGVGSDSQVRGRTWQKQDAGCTTNWIELARKAPVQSTSVERFVDPVLGTDTPQSGSALQPYRSIQYAMDQITDAAQGKRYVLNLSAGDYSAEGSITGKPFIDLLGKGRGNTILAGYSLTNNEASGAVEISSLNITGILAIDNTGAGATVWQNIIRDCLVNEASFTANITGPFAKIYDSQVNTVRALGANVRAWNCFIPTHTEISGNVNSFVQYTGSLVQGTCNLTAPGQFYAYGSVVIVNFTNTGTPTIDTDALSFTYGSLTGAFTQVRSDLSQSVAYTPSAPAQWANPEPDQVKSAIDRLAAAVFALRGNVAIP